MEISSTVGRGVDKITGIKELLEKGLQEVPPVFVRPPHERPASVPGPDYGRDNQSHPHQIPVIDLADLMDCNTAHQRRSSVVEKIGRACAEWGFFQVVNHGVKLGVIQGLREAALAFFSQPADERMKLYKLGLKDPVSYTTCFNPHPDIVRDWREALGFRRNSGECDGFQQAPEICREPLLKYVDEVERLANLLHNAIFESMDVQDMLKAGVPNIPGVLMSINYYPPCPNPSLTLGLSGHSDASSLTILHPDFDVPGLEVRKDNTWVPIKPCQPDAFVVNLADQVEILTNGKYKSIEHRVVTNSNAPRMSIACFFGPSEDAIIAPLPGLLNGNNPPLYKPTRFGDYFKSFATSKLLADRGSLNFAKV